MSTFDGHEWLFNFYAGAKRIAGITPVHNFKQSSREYVKEYMDRESLVWEEAQGATAHMYQLDDISSVHPVHDHMRGMLLLRRTSTNFRG